MYLCDPLPRVIVVAPSVTLVLPRMPPTDCAIEIFGFRIEPRRRQQLLRRAIVELIMFLDFLVSSAATSHYPAESENHQAKTDRKRAATVSEQ
jgi:hypothetical protein